MASLASAPAAFGALRPLCVQLTREQTVQNVQSLRAQLSSVEVHALQELLEYVLFPLRFALKIPGPKKQGLVQAVLECIAHLLSCARLRSPDTLREMFCELCSCLPPDPAVPVSEELKLALVCALRSLLLSPGADAIPALYQPPMLPHVGFAVTLLLTLAEREKSREIRVEALSCLDALLLQRPGQEDLLGDLFASFLPGLCTGLARVICGDPKQGHKVTAGAVRVWSGAVSLVMSDEQLARVPADKPSVSGVSGRVAELLVHRDPPWVRNTGSRLHTLLDGIAERCASDPHWRVRLALVDLAQLLLSRCLASLGEAAGSLLRVLVGRLGDESPEVRVRVREALRELEGSRSWALGEALSESLHSLAVSLPRVLSSQDDQGKLRTLGLLHGYLQLLGPRLALTLRSHAHLQRLSAALVHTLELDLCGVKVVEERYPAAAPLCPPDLAGAPQKSFRFFRDPRVLDVTQSVCRLLGYHGDLCLMADHFLGLFRARRMPAVLVLNQLVLGAAGLKVDTLDGVSRALGAEELLDTVRPLLEEYTDPANWHLPICLGSDDLREGMASLRVASSAGPTLGDMSANAWQLCLQLEGIAGFARALGPSFRPLLITALYPLLEKAGEPSLLVSGAAARALGEVSGACGYEDVGRLIEGNSDYLAGEISVGLRRLEWHGGAARVLGAVLENCGPGLLPLLGELVQDLLPALDQSQDEGARRLLPVLHTLLARLVKWFPPADAPLSAEFPGDSRPAPEHAGNLTQEIQDFLRDHMEQQRLARGEVQEQASADPPSPPEYPDDDPKPPMQIHVQISKEVTEKCVHFLSHSDPRLRLQALDSLRLGLLSLQSQDEVLLPLAHRVWPCLLQRLLQDEPVILLRAFQVLLSLTDCCREFLRQRVCKDALPALLDSLRSQAPVSARAGPVYSHTHGYKLQLGVLQGLGTLCVTLQLGDSDLREVMGSCMLYLSARQPSKLQEAAISAFLSVARLDPDAAWLHLCEWQCPPVPPHPCLTPLPWAGKACDEYTHNILRLLQQLA